MTTREAKGSWGENQGKVTVRTAEQRAADRELAERQAANAEFLKFRIMRRMVEVRKGAESEREVNVVDARAIDIRVSHIFNSSVMTLENCGARHGLSEAQMRAGMLLIVDMVWANFPEVVEASNYDPALPEDQQQLTQAEKDIYNAMVDCWSINCKRLSSRLEPSLESDELTGDWQLDFNLHKDRVKLLMAEAEDVAARGAEGYELWADEIPKVAELLSGYYEEGFSNRLAPVGKAIARIVKSIVLKPDEVPDVDPDANIDEVDTDSEYLFKLNLYRILDFWESLSRLVMNEEIVETRRQWLRESLTIALQALWSEPNSGKRALYPTDLNALVQDESIQDFLMSDYFPLLKQHVLTK